MAACAESGSGQASSDQLPPPFRYQTTETLNFELQVTLDGAPRAGAIVQVLDHLPQPASGQVIEELITGNVYYHGQTDSNGEVQAALKLPTSVDQFDVLVDDPGSDGPFTVASHRTRWGRFSPSARVRLDKPSLANANIELEDQQ